MDRISKGARPWGARISLDSIKRLHVADASVIINLNASGCAREIASAFPGRIAVVDIVLGELETGRPKGRQDAALLRQLIDDGAVDLVRLDDDAEEHFARLVIGPAEATLDDGEAATLAYAVQQEGVVIIDERKATRLCAALFPQIVVRTSLDLFAHADVLQHLGSARLGQALFEALVHGRMRVPPQFEAWIVEQIGPARAGQCPSLPPRLRIGKGA